MPQLDKLTFTTQIFWLFLTFFSLYWITSKKILPTILSIVRTRQLLLSKMALYTTSTEKETSQLDRINSDFQVALAESLFTYMKYADSNTSLWYKRQKNNPYWVVPATAINHYLYILSRVC